MEKIGILTILSVWNMGRYILIILNFLTLLSSFLEYSENRVYQCLLNWYLTFPIIWYYCTWHYFFFNFLCWFVSNKLITKSLALLSFFFCRTHWILYTDENIIWKCLLFIRDILRIFCLLHDTCRICCDVNPIYLFYFFLVILGRDLTIFA